MSDGSLGPFYLTNLLAVGVLSFNHPGITAGLIGSLLRFFTPNRIFLLHNGSEKKWVTELENLFPEINHLKIERNISFCAGANHLLHEIFASGEISDCFFLCNDNVVDHFSVGHEILEDLKKKYPQGYFVGPLTFLRGTGKVESYGGLVDFGKGRLLHLKEDFENSGSFEDIGDRKHYLTGNSFIIDKTAFIRTQGFDESFEFYWEDVDLSLRARKLGIKLLKTKNIQMRHGVRKTCTEEIYSSYYFHRNRKRVVYRHGTWSERVKFFPRFYSEMTWRIGKALRGGKKARAILLARAVRGK